VCGRLAMWDSPQCALGEFSSHCARPPSVRSRRRNPCFVLSAVQALLRRPARSRGYTSTALRWEIFDAWAIEAPISRPVTAFQMVACLASSPLWLTAHCPRSNARWSCAPAAATRPTCPCARRAVPLRSSLFIVNYPLGITHACSPRDHLVFEPRPPHPVLTQSRNEIRQRCSFQIVFK
jgi:hypothetical protein